MERLVMILLMSLFCMSNVSYAGNGDLTVGGSLEMTSSTNGFLPPRMATSDRGNLAPSPGMLIYNTDDNAYNYYTSSGWKILAASLPVHDNTGASSDYALAVGETAKITFNSATSVLLHVQTDPTAGVYEVDIACDLPISVSANTDIYFKANNATYSAEFIGIQYYADSTSISGGNINYDYVRMGSAYLHKAKLLFTTKTTGKTITMDSLTSTNTTTHQLRHYMFYWNDTATSWTSLGTLVFPTAQSGNIVIKRVS